MSDSGLILPGNHYSELAREVVAAASDGMPSVGTPRKEDQRQPRTIKILPDMSVLVWHHASVEARGGLTGPDGQPLRKMDLVLDLLSPDEAFDFFHRQALNFAEFLVERDKQAEAEKQKREAKPAKQRASKKERKARRKKMKGRRK